MANVGKNNSQTETDRVRFVRDLILLFLYGFTSLVALISNALVIRISLGRRRRKSISHPATLSPLSTTSMFLLNLAMADALTAVTIPVQFVVCSGYVLQHVQFSSYLCVAIKSTQILAYNASTLTICVIAIDRYRLIHNPLKHSCRRQLYRAMLFTWILPILFSGTCLFSMRVPTYFNSHDKLISCQLFLPLPETFLSITQIRRIRISFLTIIFFIFPLLIISIVCLLTMRIIAQRSIIGVKEFQSFSQTRTRSTRLLMVVVIVFILSHLPVHSVHLIEFFFLTSKSSGKCNESTFYLFSYWLGISSCCHNPIIYSWFNRQFRMIFSNFSRSFIAWRRWTI